MNVRLDPNDQKHLEELAHSEGKDPGELLSELVHEAITERKRNGAQRSADEEALLAKQSKAWDELLAEVDAFPEVEPKDDICVSRDHDRILYGGPAPGQKGGFTERRS